MKISMKTKKSIAIYCVIVLMITLFAVPVYAANDPNRCQQLIGFIFD